MKTIEDHYDIARLTPGDIHEHIPTLRQYGLLCEHITEFGVRAVCSTWAFLAAYPKVMRSYDITPCPVQEAERLAKEAGIDFRFIQGDTHQVDIEPTDLLFIDTVHNYDHVTKELNLHAGFVRKYLIFHDTQSYGRHGDRPGTRGLLDAIDEFLAAHPEWNLAEKFDNCYGLTILERL